MPLSAHAEPLHTALSRQPHPPAPSAWSDSPAEAIACTHDGGHLHAQARGTMPSLSRLAILYIMSFRAVVLQA